MEREMKYYASQSLENCSECCQQTTVLLLLYIVAEHNQFVQKSNSSKVIHLSELKMVVYKKNIILYGKNAL